MNVRRLLNDLNTNRLYHRRKVILDNRPTVYAVETTNHCNLDCVMCPRPLMKRQKGFMDVALFEKIVKEAEDFTSIVWLHLFGEPLLHPELDRIIECCHAHGLQAGLSTNCMLLNEDISRKLLESGLDQMIMSLDGATEQTYKKLRKNGDFEQSVGNAMRFLDLKAQGGFKKPVVSVQVIRMKETDEELDAYRRQWQGRRVHINIKRLNTWPVELDRIDPNYRPAERKHIVYPCKWLWRYAVVFWDGTVVPCFSDFDGEFVLGNLREQSLEQIWNGPAAVELRRQHVEGNFPQYCVNCDEPVGEWANPLYPLDWRPIVNRTRSIMTAAVKNRSNA